MNIQEAVKLVAEQNLYRNHREQINNTKGAINMNATVLTRERAWQLADELIPTDYQKDEAASKRAGYPIYKTTSTDERFAGFHISDLNTRLEVNMGNETVMIWIKEDAFEIVVKGLRENEKASLKEVVDKEIRRIKYRRHKEKASNLRYEIDLNL